MTEPFFMNSYLGKRILALVRDGDYAHAGEEEAIALAMAPVAKDARRRILDAGCGRGGTAAYMQAGGWGSVTGIDIEPKAVDYARATYPEATFLQCDIAEVAARFEEPFDVVTMFNVFYALPDHVAALRALAGVSGPNAQLVIFDYVDPGGYQDAPMMDGDIRFLPNPVPLAGLGETLASGGWRLQSVKDLSADYVRWYAALVAKIEAKRDEIVALAGGDIYEHVHGLYAGLEAAVREGRVGGAVIYAEKAGP
jgi:SAM-dependent methyltransferase